MLQTVVLCLTCNVLICVDAFQAEDALRFASDPGSPAVRRQAAHVEVAWAALAQEPGQPVPLEEQARTSPLLALRFVRPFTQGVPGADGS